MFSGPFQFVEHPGGSPWFGPWHRRARFFFGPKMNGFTQMTVRFDEIPDERKTVKVMGLSAIYPSMLWPPTARRVERYGMSEWPDFAHENSWRVIAHLNGKRGTVRFASYTYTDARGGIGPPEQVKPESAFLGEVRVGEKATLSVEVRGKDVLYTCRTGAGVVERHEEPLRCSPLFYWKHFAHSSGVTSDTSGRIVFTAWK